MFTRCFSTNFTNHKRIVAFGFTYLKAILRLSSEERNSLKEVQLILNFKEKFPSLDLKDFKSIMHYISLSSEAQDWYHSYKEAMAAISSMPDAFIQNKVTLEEWNEIQKRQVLRNDIIAKHSSEAQVLSNAYQDQMKAKANDLKSKLDTFSGLERVLSIGAKDLSTADKVSLSKELNAEKRKELSDELIQKKQSELTKYYKDKGTFPVGF